MKEQIPLMLDTTVFKQVPKLDSQLFNELIRYTRADIYTLYISEIVEMEYLTWIQSEAQEAYDTVNKATKSLSKFYEEPSIFNFTGSFNTTAFMAESEINRILKKVVDNWEDFKIKTKATILPIQNDHGRVVMNAYFKGDKPFRKSKHRADIPDAFVYFGLKSILNSKEKVIFVSADAHLCEQIKEENLLCFGNLSELFSKGPEKLDENYFVSLRKENRFFTLVKIFEDEILRKLTREIEFSDLNEEILQDKNVTVVGEYADSSTSILELKLEEISVKSITEHSFLVPFKGAVRCSINSIASKDDVSFLNDQRLKYIEREVTDDGDFKLCEYHEYSVSGHFSLTFDETDPSSWKEHKTSDTFWATSEIKEIILILEDMQRNV